MTAEQASLAGTHPSGVRLAHLTAALSLAVDLGTGQPMEHVARSCLLAMRLGERVGMGDEERASLYYVAQLGWVGCIADSADVAPKFGDDLTYRDGSYEVDMKPLSFLGYLLRRANEQPSLTRRMGVSTALLATGAKAVQDSLRAHCQVTVDIANRLGLGPSVQVPLEQVFARWDGMGLPAGLSGTDIALPIRLWHIADVAEVLHRRHGLAVALTRVGERRGTQFDPELVDRFVEVGSDLFDTLPEESTWDDIVAEAPILRPELSERGLDEALEVFADYADLKSPYYRGHSRGVAVLAAAAAERLGLDAADVRLVRRAGLVHDVGRVGVPNTIWDKGGPLTRSERERARLHAYYTERVLARPARLREIGRVAGMAHERLDGSGYPHGLSGPAIPVTARVLAVADRYYGLLESRPHRPPLAAADAAGRLQAEQRSGALEGDAVDAVLAVAGQPLRHRPAGPRGLTTREVQVLALLARGASNRQISRELGIAPKTVESHVEHIYAKVDVTTRAAATLFALRHGLLRTLDPVP